MKIAWLINIVMPEVAEKLGLWKTSLGGWLVGQLNGIKKTNTELHIICVSNDIYEIKKLVIDGVYYYVIPNKDDEFIRSSLDILFNEINYDLLHIYGTETKAAFIASAISARDKTLISIQGLTSYIAKHIGDEIPEKYYRKTVLKQLGKRLFGGSIMEDDAIRLTNSGKNEIKILRKAKYVIGRTEWDKACINQINPKALYFKCNEILRDSFYSERWSVEKCVRHSIFLSQSAYPIKGLHRVLEVLPLVLEHYPDTKVYIAGLPMSDFPKRGKLKQKAIEYFMGYQGYIEKLVSKYNLYGKLHFLNYLDEESMKEQYLKSNVFVLPSSIENSPNSLGEAMLLGVPSVASCVGGVQDMLEHQKDGFIFSPNEPYMLAHYVIKIFNDDELALKLSGNSRLHAEQTHSINLNTKQLINIYQTVIKERKYEYTPC